jgi:hypothetical protein
MSVCGMWQACPSPAGGSTQGGDCVASDAAGGEQGGRELARPRVEGARAKEGRLGLLAAGRGAGRRGRRREWQLVAVAMAAAAVATMEAAEVMAVALVAFEKRKIVLAFVTSVLTSSAARAASPIFVCSPFCSGCMFTVLRLFDGSDL